MIGNTTVCWALQARLKEYKAAEAAQQLALVEREEVRSRVKAELDAKLCSEAKPSQLHLLGALGIKVKQGMSQHSSSREVTGETLWQALQSVNVQLLIAMRWSLKGRVV